MASFVISVILKATIVSICMTVLSAVHPLSLGCIMDHDFTIRCRSNNLEYIVKSMFILVPERFREPTSADVHANGTLEPPAAAQTGNGMNVTNAVNVSHKISDPRELDIYYCDVPDLPNIFARFNNSLERIRVARSNVQSVTINAFEGLERILRFLDMSGNKLRTVPLAIQNLTRLEALNLRDNKIQVIAEGPTFHNTIRLRELHLGFNNLGYIDNSKLQIYPANPQRGSNRKQSNHAPIGLTVFNLGNTTNSLEILSLRGNDMHSFPEQLMVDIPRLKSLDLSFNSLVEIPEDAFRSMPELQFVNLDSNFIRTLKFSSLPETLKLFTMKNNPMRCDCDVKWILDWIFTNTSLTVLLPKCNAPFHLREISFLRLTDEKLCNQSRVARQTVYVTDRDLSYFPQGVFQSFRLHEVRGEFKSIFVSWKVDPQFYLSQREWLIIYRSFDDSIYTFNRTLFTSKSYVENQTDWTTVERLFNDNIRNLSAGEFYQVCLAVVENNINYIHLNHCQVAMTEKEATLHYQPQDVTVPSQMSTTTAMPSPEYLIESNLVKIKADTRSITIYWNVIVLSSNGQSSARKGSGVTGINATSAKSNGTATLTRYSDYIQAESPLVLNTLTAIYNELRWKITYRRFTSESSTAVTIMKNNYVVTGPNTHQYTIANLHAGSGYTVCFETLNDLSSSSKGKRVSESGQEKVLPNNGGIGIPRFVSVDSPTGDVCKEVVTLQEKKFPVVEVVVACVVSMTATALLLVSLFCFSKHYKKTATKEMDAENASQNTVNTDTGLVEHVEDDDDDHHKDDLDSDESDELPKSNGHLRKWPSYPKVTSIFPAAAAAAAVAASSEPQRSHSSFRHFTGIPAHMSSQRNGTYPKSILKKSPSAPSLSDCNKPVPILKRPSSLDCSDQNYPDQSSEHLDSKDSELSRFELSAKNGEVELKKLFITNPSEIDG